MFELPIKIDENDIILPYCSKIAGIFTRESSLCVIGGYQLAIKYNTLWQFPLPPQQPHSQQYHQQSRETKTQQGENRHAAPVWTNIGGVNDRCGNDIGCENEAQNEVGNAGLDEVIHAVEVFDRSVDGEFVFY